MGGDPPTAGDGDDSGEFEDPFAGLDGIEGLEDLKGLSEAAEDADPSGAGGWSGLLGGLGAGDPGGMGMFGDLMRMLQGAAPPAAQAREFARAVASGGESEPNIDPTERIAVEQLVRVAELRVAHATGLPPSRGSALRVEVTNRVGWCDRTVDDYSDLFTALGESIAGGSADEEDDAGSDPLSAMMVGLTWMIGPTMLALTSGSLVGRLAQQALGGYVLPVPRPHDKPMLIALSNVDRFAEQWSLDSDDVRLWVCLHEAAYSAVFGVDHVRGAVWDLLLRHASAFDTNPRHLDDLFEGFDPAGGPEALAEIQSRLGSPDSILGAVRSPAQEALLPQLTALLAALAGYVDHTMDRIGSELIGSYGRLSEALRRHRVEASASDRFVERLLGLELDSAQYERGAAFAAGVVERAGTDGLRRLLDDPVNLPTPAEVDAAGLWLARIDLPR